MLETVVFVLRKTKIHVAPFFVMHHATLPVFVWLNFKYYPGGQTTLFALANSIAHIVLFGYYTVVTVAPRVKDFWVIKRWKTMRYSIQVSREPNSNSAH
jgi:FtsH-binding integral membrane protein